MTFLFLIVLAFIAIAIYLFFRSENFLKQLKATQRELKASKKVYQHLNESLVTVATKNEEFLKFRFKKIEQYVEARNLPLTSYLESMSPLVQHYGHILFEVSSGNSKVKPVVQKCYEAHKKGSYKDFTNFMNSQDATVKRLWNNDNAQGLIALVEHLLMGLQEQAGMDIAAK